jgi:hypothetical protein
VNVVEVNFVTTNKIIEDQMFQERKRRKNKSRLGGGGEIEETMEGQFSSYTKHKLPMKDLLHQ